MKKSLLFLLVLLSVTISTALDIGFNDDNAPKIVIGSYGYCYLEKDNIFTGFNTFQQTIYASNFCYLNGSCVTGGTSGPGGEYNDAWINTTIDSKVTIANGSMRSYVLWVNSTNAAGLSYDDTWILPQIYATNTSMKEYVDNTNSSMKSYVDNKPLNSSVTINNILSTNITNDARTFTNTVTINNTFQTFVNNASYTNTNGLWLCTAADCSTKCQLSVINGLITGCS